MFTRLKLYLTYLLCGIAAVGYVGAGIQTYRMHTSHVHAAQLQHQLDEVDAQSRLLEQRLQRANVQAQQTVTQAHQEAERVQTAPNGCRTPDVIMNADI